MLFSEEGTSFRFHGVWTPKNGSKEKICIQWRAEATEELPGPTLTTAGKKSYLPGPYYRVCKVIDYHYLYVTSLSGNSGCVSATRKLSSEGEKAVEGGSSVPARAVLIRDQLGGWPYASPHLSCTYNCFQVTTIVSNTSLRHVNVDLISKGRISCTEHKLPFLSDPASIPVLHWTQGCNKWWSQHWKPLELQLNY